MIGTVDCCIQAKFPDMPLDPMRAYINSPSSIRIRNVPKKIGEWCITKVTFLVNYPDNTVKQVECKRVGDVYIGTVEGAGCSGTVGKGYSIVADGVDENGSVVTGYVLGKGDVDILEGSSDVRPDETYYNVHLMSAESATPKIGDMWLSGSTLNIVNIDNQVSTIGVGIPTDLSVNSLTADSAYVEFINLFDGSQGNSLYSTLRELDAEKRDLSDLSYTPTAHNGIDTWEIVAVNKQSGERILMTAEWNDAYNSWYYVDSESSGGWGFIKISGDGYMFQSPMEQQYFELDEGYGEAEDMFFNYTLTPIAFQQDKIALSSDLSDKADLSSLSAYYTKTEVDTALSGKADKYPFTSISDDSGTINLRDAEVQKFTVAAQQSLSVYPPSGTSTTARDLVFVIDCAANSVSVNVQWANNIHPHTDASTDMSVLSNAVNVYYLSEYASGQFVIAGWQETAGGN